jgi:hypothetical protein
MPILEISEQEVTDIRHGKRIGKTSTGITGLTFSSELVAVAEPASDSTLKSLVVFNEVSDD